MQKKTSPVLQDSFVLNSVQLTLEVCRTPSNHAKTSEFWQKAKSADFKNEIDSLASTHPEKAGELLVIFYNIQTHIKLWELEDIEKSKRTDEENKCIEFLKKQTTAWEILLKSKGDRLETEQYEIIASAQLLVGKDPDNARNIKNFYRVDFDNELDQK